MSRIAVMTDSNSGITRREAQEIGVTVLPMPFYIDEKLFFEEISLSQEAFYEALDRGAEISSSQPVPEDVTSRWDELLASHDEVVYIPMSSGLSSSCETAQMLAQG